MLLQSMLMLAALLVIGSALLTSTLVSAKAAFHQTIQRKSETAMNEATADFVTWAQEHVKNDGLNQTSVWSAVPQQEPPAPTCAAGDSVSPATDIEECGLLRQIRWNVTGYTGDVPSNDASQNLSEATALSSAQAEQRISATISVNITDATGRITYDGRFQRSRIGKRRPLIFGGRYGGARKRTICETRVSRPPDADCACRLPQYNHSNNHRLYK